MLWDGVRSGLAEKRGSEKHLCGQKRRENPHRKTQVLFAPRVASPRTHQHLHLKANKRLGCWDVFEMVCDRDTAEGERRGKKHSGSQKGGNPIRKTPSLLCPSCRFATQPPPPPLESHQKTFIGGMFFGMVRSRTKNKTLQKIKKSFPSSKHPKKTPPSLPSQKKKFPLGSFEKKSRAWQLLLEKTEKRKKNLNQKKRKNHSPKRQVFFVPLSASQSIRQYLHLKANKRLVFFGTVGVACDRDPATKGVGEEKRSEKKPHRKTPSLFYSPLFLYLNSSI